MLRRWDSALLPLLITALMYGGLILLTMRAQGHDFSYFVTAGEKYCQTGEVPKSLTVGKGSDGYDGQFYYRLALDPFTSKVTDFGVTLDIPAYRGQRILYPLLVWGLSFGRMDRVPALMVGVNFLGLCILGWLGGLFARSAKLHSLWGLAFSFYPGFLLSLERDLTEIVCATLLLAAVLSVRRRKYLLATLLLILAFLTRETAILVAAGAACIWLQGILGKKHSDGLPWYFPAFASLAYPIWQLVLLRNWGYGLWKESHVGAAATHALGLPLAAFFSRLGFFAALRTQAQRAGFMDMALIIVFAGAVAWSMHLSAASPFEKIVWLFYAALAAFLGAEIWVEDWAFLRALSEFYVFGTIILLLSPSRMKTWVVASWGVVWFSYFFRLTDMTGRVLRLLSRV